jgi:hypothetical protein
MTSRFDYEKHAVGARCCEPLANSEGGAAVIPSRRTDLGFREEEADR